jgi:hypothetical protein
MEAVRRELTLDGWSGEPFYRRRVLPGPLVRGKRCGDSRSGGEAVVFRFSGFIGPLPQAGLRPLCRCAPVRVVESALEPDPRRAMVGG